MITALRPSGSSAPIVRRAVVALVVILLGGSVIVSTTSAGAAESEGDGTNKTIPTPTPPALPTPSIIGSPSAFRIDAEDDDSSRILLTHPVIDDPVATITGDDAGRTSTLMIGSLST